MLVDVGLHIGEQVSPVAGLLEVRSETCEVALVVAELVAEEGDVLVLDAGGGDGWLRVQKARELAYD